MNPPHQEDVASIGKALRLGPIGVRLLVRVNTFDGNVIVTGTFAGLTVLPDWSPAAVHLNVDIGAHMGDPQGATLPRSYPWHAILSWEVV